MCNVCFTYLGIPVITNSIQTGGDYIDEQVACTIDDTAPHIYDTARFKALARNRRNSIPGRQGRRRHPGRLVAGGDVNG